MAKKTPVENKIEKSKAAMEALTKTMKEHGNLVMKRLGRGIEIHFTARKDNTVFGDFLLIANPDGTFKTKFEPSIGLLNEIEAAGFKLAKRNKPVKKAVKKATKPKEPSQADMDAALQAIDDAQEALKPRAKPTLRVVR